MKNFMDTEGMAKKQQIGVQLPPEVKRWVESTEIWKETTKTRLGLAGFVLYELASEGDKALALQLASFVDRGLLPWVEVQRLARRAPGEERDDSLRTIRMELVERKGRPPESRVVFGERPGDVTIYPSSEIADAERAAQQAAREEQKRGHVGKPKKKKAGGQ